MDKKSTLYKPLKTVWHLIPDRPRRKIYLFSRKLNTPKYYLRNERLMKRWEKFGVPTMPKYVEIETVNRCNGKCQFCPVNVTEPQREYAKMTEELFEKIIDDLHRVDYDGTLALFSNNELFIDDRIVEWHKIARKAVPKAYIHITTNGTLLTVEKLELIYPYFDILSINNYDFDMMPHMEELQNWIEKYDREHKVHIGARSRTEVLTTRGGYLQITRE